MKVAIIDPGQIVPGDWRNPLVAGGSVIATDRPAGSGIMPPGMHCRGGALARTARLATGAW
jgi:hypothetical protein